MGGSEQNKDTPDEFVRQHPACRDADVPDSCMEPQAGGSSKKGEGRIRDAERSSQNRVILV